VNSQFDSLSLPSGNVLIQLPMRSKAGKYPLTYGLVGGSHAYIGTQTDEATGNVTAQWYVSSGLAGSVSGSQYSSGLSSRAFSTSSYSEECGNITEGVLTHWVVSDAQGTLHPFPSSVIVPEGSCGSGTVSGTTTDNSGYSISITTAPPSYVMQITLWDKAGNLLQTESVTDPDGVSMTGIPGFGNGPLVVDTLGQTVVTGTFSHQTGTTWNDQYTYDDVKDNPQTVQVNYTQIPSVTAFNCPNIGDAPFATNNFPTSVVYPDGEKVTLGYEKTAGLPGWQASTFYGVNSSGYGVVIVDSNGNIEQVYSYGTSGTSQPVWNKTVGGQTKDGTVVWQNEGNTWTSGRIASITYPGGGSVTYSYSGVTCGLVQGALVGVAGWPTKITRTVNDNAGHSNTWTYQLSAPSSNNSTVTVTETDPANNVTVINYVGASTAFIGSGCTTYSSECTYTYIQAEKLSYTGAAVSQNLIGKQVTCYNGSNSSESGCVTPSVPIFFPISQTDVYTHMIGSGGTIGTASDVHTVFDTYGNVTSNINYNYGATFPPSGAPLSTTTTVYNSAGSCGTLAVAAMHDRPCAVTVSGPSGTASQVEYTYNSAGHATQTKT
jgi:hypothetical protein